MDKVSRALYLENRATAVQAEREAAAKAVEAGDKSNRKSEKDFVTGGAKGVGASIVEGAGWVLDVLMSNPKYQFGQDQLTSFESDLRTYFDSKMADRSEAERQGYDAGKVVGMLVDPGPGAELGAVAAVGKKVKKVLTREEEIAKLAAEQAGDIAAWKKRGEFQNPGYLFEQHGVPKSRIGEKQESAFPSKKSEPIYEMQDEHPVLVGDKEDQQMLEYSQAQHNPMATSGLQPQEPAPFGETMESIGALAAARTKRWKGGKFDPVVAEQDWKKVLNKRRAVAAKKTGSEAAERSPKYWVLDESDRTVYEVSLNKKGEVVTKRSKADWRWKDKDTGDFIRDKDGKVMVRPEVDEIVPKGAKEFIEAKRDKLAVEEFQASQARLSPTEAPPRDLTKWEGDAGDKPAKTAATNLYDQMEAMQWDRMTATDKRDFIENWLAKEVLPGIEGNTGEAFDPTKWRTPKPETSGKTLKTKKKK